MTEEAKEPKPKPKPTPKGKIRGSATIQSALAEPPVSPDLAASIAAVNASIPRFDTATLAALRAVNASIPRFDTATLAALGAAATPEMSASLASAAGVVKQMPSDWLTGQRILGAIETSATSSTVSGAVLDQYLQGVRRSGGVAPIMPTIPARDIDAPTPISVGRAGRGARPPKGPEAPASGEPEQQPSDNELVLLAIKDVIGEVGTQVRQMGVIAQASSAELSGLRTDLQASSAELSGLRKDLRTSSETAARWTKWLTYLTFALVAMTATLAVPIIRDWVGNVADCVRSVVDLISRG
jgi:hypothetical protein